jgi:hypothetical protein
VAFYPFKKSILIAGSQDASIKQWDLIAGLKPIFEKTCHSATVSSVCFAPCNKHFFCTAGLDGTLLFHNLNLDKPVLQSFQAGEPILSISINDEHIVAIGTTGGKILFYDTRAKEQLHVIQMNGQVRGVAFQCPKWAVSASLKDAVFVEPNQPPNDTKVEVEQAISQKTAHMDMFSPIQHKPQKMLDLRKSAAITRFNERMKTQNVGSLEKLSRSQSHEEVSRLSTPVMKQSKSEDLHAITDQDRPITPLPVPKRTPEIVKDRVVPKDAEPQKLSILPSALQDIENQVLERTVEKLGGMVGETVTPKPRTVPEPSSTPTKVDPSQFQYQVLKSIVHDIVQDHFQSLHEQINDLQIELIRQFQMQRVMPTDLE